MSLDIYDDDVGDCYIFDLTISCLNKKVPNGAKNFFKII